MGYTFEATLWKWKGDSAWHFVTLPFDIADEIEHAAADAKRGFGSVKVRARIGATRFDTSLFPDRKAESYVLPVKAQVRKVEQIGDGDRVCVHLELEHLFRQSDNEEFLCQNRKSTQDEGNADVHHRHPPAVHRRVGAADRSADRDRVAGPQGPARDRS